MVVKTRLQFETNQSLPKSSKNKLQPVTANEYLKRVGNCTSFPTLLLLFLPSLLLTTTFSYADDSLEKQSAMVQALRQQLKSEINDKRKEAILALGGMGMAAVPAIPELVEGLIDGNGEHWAAASTSLLKLGPKVIAESDRLTQCSIDSKLTRLLFMLNQRHCKCEVQLEGLFLSSIDDQAERDRCLGFLKRVRRDPAAKLPVLLGILRNDTSPYTNKLFAVQEIALLRTEARIAIPVLRDLAGDRKGKLRYSALGAIAAIGTDDPDVASFIRAILKNPSENQGIRIEAANLMRSYLALAEVSVDDLLEVMRDTSTETLRNLDLRATTMGALARIKLGPEAIPALSDVASNDLDIAATRILALKSLGRLGAKSKAAAPALLNCLLETQQNEPLTREIVNALEACLPMTELLAELKRTANSKTSPEVGLRLNGIIAYIEMQQSK